jgi:hypothetical protein
LTERTDNDCAAIYLVKGTPSPETALPVHSIHSLPSAVHSDGR